MSKFFFFLKLKLTFRVSFFLRLFIPFPVIPAFCFNSLKLSIILCSALCFTFFPLKASLAKFETPLIAVSPTDFKIGIPFSLIIGIIGLSYYLYITINYTKTLYGELFYTAVLFDTLLFILWNYISK